MDKGKTGDVVGMLLDCDSGALTFYKNGTRMSHQVTGLTGELCFAVLPNGQESYTLASKPCPK
jgi:hypothetical protein